MFTMTPEELLTTSPLDYALKQSKEDLAFERVSACSELAAQRAEIQEDFEQRLPALQEAELQAKAEFERAEARFEAAKERLIIAGAARVSAALSATAKIDRINGMMRQLAHPMLAEAKERLREREEAIRKSNQSSDILVAATNPSVEDLKKSGRASNVESINDALTYISDFARPRLNKLEITAIADDELATEIESVFDAIPKIEFRERKR